MDVFGFICDVNKLMFFDSILIYNIAVRIKLYCACGAVVGSDEKIMQKKKIMHEKRFHLLNPS